MRSTLFSTSTIPCSLLFLIGLNRFASFAKILRLLPHAVSLVGSMCQHKILQLCNHCGRMKRILQLGWSSPIIPSPKPDVPDVIKQFSLFAWLGENPKIYPMEKLDTRIATHAVLYCAYCALHTKLRAKEAFNTIQELVSFCYRIHWLDTRTRTTVCEDLGSRNDLSHS